MTLYRRSKLHLLLPAVGGLALLGLGSAALAKPANGAKARSGSSQSSLCERISCTDRQAQKLKTVRAELRADLKADRAAIKRLRKQIAAEFAKDRPSEAAMKANQKKIARHEQKIRERAFDAMMEIHAVLDAKQRATFVAMLERRGVRGLMQGSKGKRDSKGKRKQRAE